MVIRKSYAICTIIYLNLRIFPISLYVGITMVIMLAYELFTIIQISSYIWMNFRLKGISIESKDIHNRVQTKKL